MGFGAAVSGADPIDARPGFKSLFERIMTNGVRTVIVEDASRFARTLMVQETGMRCCQYELQPTYAPKNSN